ncbi:unnamed protein product [Rotaria sp. Silwood1]|nr:unnamed protein product [Rotaria sp. Silwood1]CAF4776159.1 unnamed protein product [Rotaria sp. Silwood1]CAF4930624.1 unnamed protein product [Rotaria sp. Silwood1]
MLNTLATTSKSGFFLKGLYEWLSSGFNIVVSVVSSGEFVGSCWCGIKCIRNGCVFKRSWCYLKSLAEHRRRRDIRAVSTLKIGLTTCFEGFQRERRRGTILFLGSKKKDCCAYGLDVAGDDGYVNMYQWSVHPGLREESE